MDEVTLAAERWMAQLPREHFDLLLRLTNNAHARGCRETREFDANIVEDEMPAVQCMSVAPIVEALQRAAAAIRNGGAS